MEFEVKRNQLIEELRQHGISERVLAAMKSVPRHLFVPEREQENAYGDYSFIDRFRSNDISPSHGCDNVRSSRYTGME